MRSELESVLPWWVAGPVLGLVIIGLLGVANRRFGVTGGLTDLVHGSLQGRLSWRAVLVIGIVGGSGVYALASGGVDAGARYSWLDAHLPRAAEIVVLFVAGLAIGLGARTAGGCTSGHGLTGVALGSRASLVGIMVMMASAIATMFTLQAAL